MGVAFFFVISGFLLYRPFLAARFAGAPAAARPRLRAPARAAHRARRTGSRSPSSPRRSGCAASSPATGGSTTGSCRTRACRRRCAASARRGRWPSRRRSTSRCRCGRWLMARAAARAPGPHDGAHRDRRAAGDLALLDRVAHDRLRRARDPEPRRHPAARQRRLVRLRDGPRAGHGRPGRSRARVARRAGDLRPRVAAVGARGLPVVAGRDPARHEPHPAAGLQRRPVAGRAPDLPAHRLPARAARRPSATRAADCRAGSSATRCWRGSGSSPTGSSSGISR